MAGNVVIRPVGSDERAAWEPLWNGYLAFYEATLAPGASDVAWDSSIFQGGWPAADLRGDAGAHEILTDTMLEAGAMAFASMRDDLEELRPFYADRA